MFRIPGVPGVQRTENSSLEFTKQISNFSLVYKKVMIRETLIASPTLTGPGQPAPVTGRIQVVNTHVALAEHVIKDIHG